MTHQPQYTISLNALTLKDVDRVGGKNAAMGAMASALFGDGVNVPPGFATTIYAYNAFLAQTGVGELIARTLRKLRNGDIDVAAASGTIRDAMTQAEMPQDIRDAIVDRYQELGGTDVAVRSSATAEDLPTASFAGQYETFLNVRGEQDVIECCKRCFASLFSERAMAYREQCGFDHFTAAMSVGVQRMVRADRGSSGVAFTLDTETGFPDVVIVNGAWGLGEAVVQGRVVPDEFMVFKPLLDEPGLNPIIGKTLGTKSEMLVYGEDDTQTRFTPTSESKRSSYVLSDEQVVHLARLAVKIENHFGKPMDVEWAHDAHTGTLYVVQARPETVQSRSNASPTFSSYEIKSKGEMLVSGIAIGSAIVAGHVCRLDTTAETDGFADGCILVTRMTDPNWVPLMRRAAAIVTDHGGRTSHAAIVSRELGVPAITGTGIATKVLTDGQEVTVCCAEGLRGHVYAGRADYSVERTDLSAIPRTRTQIMLNVGDPDNALRWWRLPADGVGLARLEFIIANMIQCHPLALKNFERLEDESLKAKIEALTPGYEDKSLFFVETLARGTARIAASVHPNPVIVRMSDFKTNEYADLVGGAAYEPDEENPMIGWRGASRYYHTDYKAAFALECQAIRFLRETIGMRNVIVMIPFCRTPAEADTVLGVMAENGLKRGEDGLEVYMMCEVPSNAVLVEQFAKRFDGFSIGSNDLTQLLLGIDRDSQHLAELFDETNDAVMVVISEVIHRAHKCGRKVGLCGEAPSYQPQFVEFLVRAGIDSVSVTPDSFHKVKAIAATAEAGISRRNDKFPKAVADVPEFAVQAKRSVAIRASR